MEFKAGNRVEVLRRNEKSRGSWFPAKILSADGYEYTLRYEQFLTNEGEPVVEKVHEDDIRPCPPPMHGDKKWILGDIVEVFDLHSWRVGKIMKVLRNNYFVVKIFDSIQLKEFHISGLRVRQSWHNNRWVMAGKVTRKKQLDNDYTNSTYKYTAHLDCGPNDAMCEESCNRERINQGQDHTFPPARTVKRNFNFHSLLTDHAVTGTSKNRKIISKDWILKSGAVDIGGNSSSLPLRIIEESNECSVASCSGHGSLEYDSRNYSREIPSSLFGDATSGCQLKTGGEYPSTPGEKLAVNIHELELHAYQSTMNALYASGPLSWEQESLLTNLRLSLHISNEEHLTQLKNLLSTST